MKNYPSIERNIIKNVPIIAFDKLDGSLIRAEWTRKNGFCKFGRKKGLLDHAEPILLKAPDLIRQQEDVFSKICRKNRWDKITAFFEFFGDSSFAGQHKADDQHRVVLFDVCINDKGLLDPKDFVKIFQDINCPAILYRGIANKTLVDEVQNGTLTGMTHEGIVCKGTQKNRTPIMFKIKSKYWIEKLKTFCGDDESKFKELL